MATLDTVQSGSLADPATFGGSLPNANDNIRVNHSGCTVPASTTIECVNLTTGMPSTNMAVVVEGTLISTGTINPLRDRAVDVRTGGVLSANTVLASNNWDSSAVLNNGGQVAINLISLSNNQQPARGLLNLTGYSIVNELSTATNGGIAEAIRINGGLVEFNGQITGGANNSIPIFFLVNGGQLTVISATLLNSTNRRRLISQTGGTVTVNNLTIQPSVRQSELISSTGGNLNFNNATVTVTNNALFEILKTNGQVDLTNCHIINHGNTLLRNITGSTWVIDGMTVLHANGSVLLSSNISNLQSQGWQRLTSGRLISGGV